MIPTAEQVAAAPVPGTPRDAWYERAAHDGLVWLPELGMGRLVVHEAPYDAAYFAKYEAYAATDMGRRLTRARVQLVNGYTAGEVVDVGIGCGDFITARGGPTYGYDINPAGVDWLERQGRMRDPYSSPVDSVSLWDVLEHIPEPGALLRNVRRYLFTSLPIVPGEGPPAKDWKHLRRDEHCWYWTRAGFCQWIHLHGFDVLDITEVEQQLGREDVLTFACERRRG